jgi:hypothetical protein
MNARRTVKVRCVHEFPEPEYAPQIGCGWVGNTTAIKQYGTTTYQIEECPDCQGAIEPLS